MKIVLASRNKHKIIEWQNTLSKFIDGVEILSLDEVGVFGEIEENGNTFKENAKIKAEAAAKSGYISVGEDSGLSVNALDGAPGVYSARYAGEHGNDRANNELLLQNLMKETDRTASFVCTIALVDPHDPDGQFIDRGFSYTLAVYYLTEEQKQIAEDRIHKLENTSGKQVFISVEPFRNFYTAEEYHQNYDLKNPEAFEKELVESGRKKA
jgi:non-canonical purine NTP pyrophosphatase (RdgB/HAM1 family)